ncbi:ABC transporter substrate-binding protein [Jannaschia sp. CCS1]|uniref:ABC transporter substrate-binding protein n=1 Tax=Jannaschia sp. (strain CCS1) TaxID=290400 RepID=UPI000053A6C4|nr:iron-siderophore ABC transporter substrate-binding protein [Jannaschia sp. CCS1]ABD55039.1 periplasmic binding protein [Jannaschia sp. CCS1]
MRLSILATVVTLALSGTAFADTITHAMGETDVPEAPQRIVMLTNEGTEALLSLGLTPVGAANSWTGDPWYTHITPQMDGVEPLGNETGINLELVAALEPDLILGNMQRHEEIYTQLSAIAPTVMSERLRGDWRVNYALYAEAVGMADEGAQILADYDARVAELSEALGDNLSEEVSVIRFLAAHIRIYQLDSFSGVILSNLGFARPAIQDVEDFAMRVGRESIPDMDGDRIFHFTYDNGNGEGEAAAEQALVDPLWQGLAAVQEGRVHSVSDEAWNTAGGILAARLMLDDIARIYGVE